MQFREGGDQSCGEVHADSSKKKICDVKESQFFGHTHE